MQVKQVWKNSFWLVLGAVLAWLILPFFQRIPGHTPIAEPLKVTPAAAFTHQEERTISVFQTASPSVVYITTTDKVLDFWTRNVSERPSGTGTGFVWDKQGHIVTNYHVVEGYKTAKIRLSDQRIFEAEVVGASPRHDLAVLKMLNPKEVPPAVQIGSSSDIKVGQTVLAIGNPFGLDHTLTTGVVSALGRSIDGDGSANTMEDLIQTDAAINPGNSGGPLLDSSGRVIGVNVAIYSPSGASAGIGFAIPVDTVNRVVPQLVQNGRYVRPVLGITMNDDVNERVIERLGVKGVLVLEVDPKSPAHKAGLRGTIVQANDELILGDIIQAIDGKPVTNTGELSAAMDKYTLNDTVKLQFLREGSTAQEVEVKLTMQR
ncbi:S1C family serine protease [Thiothrix eikelboomii]|uniref:Serine protease, S1-C subfamily, contains C-terminal PDZ domain n=1 Tax=Thiothrix eikelboomii TaxID=92487 RepID=A0A1T4XBG7_9GAMM|nr:trypsin-like peptidase domain-containing protein [Thiothrix eikelboomii]SKA86930.1 serine protease, S1-C subfamily, contains C-terminal PDZ domain [Thiothrix eikelboomii]